MTRMARDVVRKFIRVTGADGYMGDLPMPPRQAFTATMALLRSAFV